MSTQPSARPCQLYPAYCFRESPTFNTWVKITAADLHNLREEPHFSGQHIYFHLNHPIRYVRLVGVVVAIDDITAKYTMVTIDDGSGANIDLKIERIPPAEQNPVDTSSNTIIENVDIISRLGIFEIVIDGRMIDIGTVVKVKGTISEFRGNKQVDLKRIWVVPTTKEEAQTWAETAAFKLDILSKPWHLTAHELHRIEKRIKTEKKKMREFQRRQLEHRAKREEQRKVREAYMKRREAKLEIWRLKEERILNAGALI